MADVIQYRIIAHVCAEIAAQANRSARERETWLRIQRGWLELARKAGDPKSKRVRRIRAAPFAKLTYTQQRTVASFANDRY
jgi:NAD-dependent oxidoreductase involved in siderophore biosynthesis